MNQIKPLASLSAAELRDLAHAAADRGEPVQQANPFDDPRDTRSISFECHYWERLRELQDETV